MYLAVDIGGTYIKHACVSADGTISARGQTPSPRGGIPQFVQAIREICEPLRGAVEAIGISFPGLVDTKSGEILFAGSYQFLNGQNLYALLRPVLSVPVTADRDGFCAARGELWKGCLRQARDAIVMVFGTGIAGALIQDRRIRAGAHNAAGELSYALRNAHPTLKTFPEVASIPILARRVAERKGLSAEQYSGEQLFQDAEDGDAEAQAAIESFFENAAMLMMNLQAIYDPEVIAIGGGVSRRDDLLPRLRKKLQEIQERSWLPLYLPQLVRCEHGNEANLLGAVYPFVEARQTEGSGRT